MNTRRFATRLICLAAAALMSFAAGPLSAQGGVTPAGGDAVKAAVESWLKGRFKVDEVRKTPMSGMWEVRFGNDLIYVDDKGQYAFVEGNMVDLKSGRNLTRERVDELMTMYDQVLARR